VGEFDRFNVTPGFSHAEIEERLRVAGQRREEQQRLALTPRAIEHIPTTPASRRV
jgi:hypothetical protein